uniref:Thioredoxin domain-containing protein n=1 Tax=Pseudo-nitzschia australis TaxID=44445 RepID=A0A7S4A9A6_9STRA|mmetsp:Transcript_3976/g.8553  ORF Transcript_3976/g.8553 Transcript_3976/m.8553 type:complete len:149 (+) Transcript_3976:123-569(+)|eukprot:CAMPEP_0168172312 /NCGR_PEP_ID=MMETSP0139_2-20121125/5171_1 /TAXON_ID=44445 /ORGANISM="Pseudo-nitzschia australis, Strain 10249 10 AB" /LENGTH=148 /DNA_ID=CAMNT_0008089923 /DNA_START=113 /DNA_END=559 /DNA_ORIENTATION=-
MNRFFLLTLAFAALFSVDAFTPTTVNTSTRQSSCPNTQLMAVVDIDGEVAFDKTIKSSGESLVIVDYSTTWCGPCKVIAPKFSDFSDKYPDAVFLKVVGDASAEASKLMKREGVRSVPSFHYFKEGEKIDVVNGANAEAIEACITKHL